MIYDVKNKLFNIKLKNSKILLNTCSIRPATSNDAGKTLLNNSMNSILYSNKNYVSGKLIIYNNLNSNIKLLDENEKNISWKNSTNSIAKINRQSKLNNADYYTMISRRCYQNEGDIYWDNKLKNSIYIVSSDFSTDKQRVFRDFLQNKVTNLNFNTIKINESSIISGYFNRKNL
jgi:hypothetical protein